MGVGSRQAVVLPLGGSWRAWCCAVLRGEANFPKYKLHSTSTFLFYILKKFCPGVVSTAGCQAVACSCGVRRGFCVRARSVAVHSGAGRQGEPGCSAAGAAARSPRLRCRQVAGNQMPKWLELQPNFWILSRARADQAGSSGASRTPT